MSFSNDLFLSSSNGSVNTAASPSGGADLTRWLVRHGMTDAYAKWLGAPPERRPVMAFTAIAGEADLLRRIKPDDAIKLTAEADVMLARIGSVTTADPATSAAVQTVTARITDWRRATGRWVPPVRTADPAAAARAEEAMSRFPQFSPSFASSLFELAREPEGLLKLDAPLDKVCALVAASVSARSARGLLDGMGFDRTASMDVIRNVQAWSQLTGRNPFLVDAYKGDGQIVDRVTAMAIDSSTCVDMAALLPTGIARPGFAMWREAEEFNAYAMLQLRDSPWESMRGDQAIVIAQAAARFAAKLRENPTLPAPNLPVDVADKTVDDVYHYARSKTWVVTENGLVASRAALASMSDDDRAAEQRRLRISELRRRP